MNGRVKFQVWSPEKQLWRTAYVRIGLLPQNVQLLVSYGFTVRVDGCRYEPEKVAA